MKPKLERLRRELEALEHENAYLTVQVTAAMAAIQQANAALIRNGQARIDTAAAIEAIEKKKERKRAKAFCKVPRCMGRAK
jgi:hypothetical protein